MAIFNSYVSLPEAKSHVFFQKLLRLREKAHIETSDPTIPWEGPAGTCLSGVGCGAAGFRFAEALAVRHGSRY